MATLQATAGLTVKLQFGENLWWFFGDTVHQINGLQNQGGRLAVHADSTNLAVGDTAIIAGVKNLNASNGTTTITNISGGYVRTNIIFSASFATTVNSTIRGGSMAFYDAETSADAIATLGRPLKVFNTQDDDISGSPTDVLLLQNRLKNHIKAIRDYVISSYPGAVIELLYPTDVNFDTCYHTTDVPYPQGGRLNRAASWPLEFQAPGTAPFNRLKIECLSWGVTYRNLTNTLLGLSFPLNSPNSWTLPKVIYLMPNFNPGVSQPLEYHAAQLFQYPTVAVFAIDHIDLYGWPIAKPRLNIQKAQVI